MPLNLQMSPRRLKQIYLVWIVLAVIAAVISLLTGEYVEMMSAAVDKVPKEKWPLSKFGMVTAFSLISITYFLVLASLGWFLLVQAVNFKTWAKVLFACFCIYEIYDAVDVAVVLPRMYPDYYSELSSKFLNWAGAIFSVMIFSLLGYSVVCLNKPKRSGAGSGLHK